MSMRVTDFFRQGGQSTVTRARLVSSVLSDSYYARVALIAALAALVLFQIVELILAGLVGWRQTGEVPTSLSIELFPFAPANYLHSHHLTFLEFPLLSVSLLFGDDAGRSFINPSLMTLLLQVLIALLTGASFSLLYYLRACTGSPVRARMGSAVLGPAGLAAIGASSSTLALVGGCCGGFIPFALLSSIAGSPGVVAGAVGTMTDYGIFAYPLAAVVLLLNLYLAAGFLAYQRGQTLQRRERRRIAGIATKVGIGAGTLLVAAVMASAVVYQSDSAPLNRNRARDTDPSWSPNGKLLAFVSNRTGQSEIWLMNELGRGLRRLTDIPYQHKGRPTWNPDGTRLVFAIAGRGIWAVDRDGQNLLKVFEEPELVADPTWAPDGKAIAFVRKTLGSSEIWRVDLDGTKAQQFTGGPGLKERPAWSPDGHRIAFTLIGDTSSEIWILNRDGTGASQVSRGPGKKRDPAWSPDGRLIAFISDARGHPNIWALELKSGRLMQLTKENQSDIRGLDWNRDGVRLAYGKTDLMSSPDIWVFRLRQTLFAEK